MNADTAAMPAPPVSLPARIVRLHALADGALAWLKAPVDREQFHSPSSEALKTAVRQEIEHLLKQGLKRHDKPSPPRPAGAPPRTGRGAHGAGGKPGGGKKPAMGGPRG